MKRLFGFLFLVGVVLLSASLIFAASPKTSQVPGPITSLPFTIDTPGYWYLTGNLTNYSLTTDGIIVTTPDVTIDLMGFCLTGPGKVTSYVAINSRAAGNTEVRNGSLDGWGTGFWGRSSRALNLRLKECNTGINIEDNGLVKDCVCYGGGSGTGIANVGVTTGNIVSNYGIGISCSGTVINNSVLNCRGEGIHGNGPTTIIGNMVSFSLDTSYGAGIDTFSAIGPCLVMQNTVSGASTINFYHFNSNTVNVDNAAPSTP
jgi:hypothetical protein